MAHLVTSVIDKYHDILDNKSGKYETTYGLLLLCNASKSGRNLLLRLFLRIIVVFVRRRRKVNGFFDGFRTRDANAG